MINGSKKESSHIKKVKVSSLRMVLNGNKEGIISLDSKIYQQVDLTKKVYRLSEIVIMALEEIMEYIQGSLSMIKPQATFRILET